MGAKKIKRYRLGVSRTFPKGHARAGQPTEFVEKIIAALIDYSTGAEINELADFDGSTILTADPKLHTCRKNYELWAMRMNEVQEGQAVIELFYWSASPYNYKRDGSKQVVFATLDKNTGCGVQELVFYGNSIQIPCIDTKRTDYAIKSEGNLFGIQVLAKNDGLSFEDFKSWFNGSDLSKPMAIIHFTKFRY